MLQKLQLLQTRKTPLKTPFFYFSNVTIVTKITCLVTNVCYVTRNTHFFSRKNQPTWK